MVFPLGTLAQSCSLLPDVFFLLRPPPASAPTLATAITPRVLDPAPMGAH